MTKEALEKLEEKILLLLAEMDKQRSEIKHLRFENSSLKAEKRDYAQKLQVLINKFDDTPAFLVNEHSEL